jgi:FAD/FMN-containing dehydrogenase
MTTRLGVWGANRAQWSRGRRKGARKPQRETYAAANFLLDAIPNWRDIYKPGGLIQHQSFVPREAASSVFAEVLRRSQAAGCVPSLAVLKKHRGDDFTLSYLLDGYSLALDYPVRRRHEQRLLRLMRELNDVLADHGGRVYFAKDSTATAEQVARMYPPERLAEFVALKARYDPHGLLSTDLYRRVLAPGVVAHPTAGAGVDRRARRR